MKNTNNLDFFTMLEQGIDPETKKESLDHYLARNAYKVKETLNVDLSKVDIDFADDLPF